VGAIYALTYGAGIYVYAGSTGQLATSTDAITWTARTSGTSSLIAALTYGNGIYMCGGQGGLLRTASLYSYDSTINFALPTTSIILGNTVADPQAYIKTS
jgi:hypothetical protein